MGVGVGADALEVREFGLEQVEQFEHAALGDGERVAVGQEDPVDVGLVALGEVLDVLDDLGERADPEGLVHVRAAERAVAVGAAVHHLQDEAVGLARRPDDVPVVSGVRCSTYSGLAVCRVISVSRRRRRRRRPRGLSHRGRRSGASAAFGRRPGRT